MSKKPAMRSLDQYDVLAKSLVGSAQAMADERSHAIVDSIHLLVQVLDHPQLAEVFRKAGVNPLAMADQAEKELQKVPRSATEVAHLSDRLLELLSRAEREASREKSSIVDVVHLLHALVQEVQGPAGNIMLNFNLGPGVLRKHTEGLGAALAQGALESGRELQSTAATTDLIEHARKGGWDPVIGRDGEVRRVLQVLERRGKHHPLLVGEAGVGKTSIVRALATRISQGDVPPNLTGLRMFALDTGVLMAGARLRGELEDRVRRLIQELIRSAAANEVALVIHGFDALFGQGTLGTSVSDLLKPVLTAGEIRLVASTTPEGLRKIRDRHADLLRQVTILSVEPPSEALATEILRGIAHRYEEHHGVRIGERAIVAAVQLAKRYLQDRELPDSAIDLLDETAARKRVEVEGVPEGVDVLLRRVEAIKEQEASLRDDTDEASRATSRRLASERERLAPQVDKAMRELESRRGAIAAASALRQQVEQVRAQLETARSAKDFATLGELEHVTLPDLERRLTKADEVVGALGSSEGNRITDADVASTLGAWTGIPVARMLEAETDKLSKMEERLGQRVVGQEEALRSLSLAVRRGRVGLRDPRKPIGSFLFLGPSGVGKTELAKALAEFLFDDESALTRLDMSEFMERHMAQRLLGAPPGYVDSEQGGFLTEAVRRRPYSVLLFDEVEKAHGDVFNLLLQVLDDGRLTDGRGRTADFSNTVVIMTSNIGAGRILDTEARLFESEEGREALRNVLLDELRAFFRPEFLNRIGDVVVFKPLSKTTLAGIVDIQVAELQKLLRERNLSVHVSLEAKQRLVELGYEPAFGARPVKRAILRHVQDPLAEMLLKAPADTRHVNVQLEDGAISVQLEAGAANESNAASAS